MTDQPTTPKKPGRPRKATAQNATTPQESPSPVSKSEVRTQVPDEAEIDTQSLLTITVEELIDGMDEALVLRVHVALARHMVQDHRMTWGEARISLGYGVANQDPQQDELWDTVYRMAKA